MAGTACACLMGLVKDSEDGSSCWSDGPKAIQFFSFSRGFLPTCPARWGILGSHHLKRYLLEIISILSFLADVQKLGDLPQHRIYQPIGILRMWRKITTPTVPGVGRLAPQYSILEVSQIIQSSWMTKTCIETSPWWRLGIRYDFKSPPNICWHQWEA